MSSGKVSQLALLCCSVGLLFLFFWLEGVASQDLSRGEGRSAGVERGDKKRLLQDEGEGEFKADPILNLFHSTIRLAGGNVFTFPGDITELEELGINGLSGFLSSEENQYYIGVMTGTIFMNIALFIWLVLLCSTCCCKCENFCPCLNDSIIIGFIVFSIVASSLGWFISIRGNAELQAGFDGSIVGVETVTNSLLSAAAGLDSLAANTDLVNNTQTLESACSQSNLVDALTEFIDTSKGPAVLIGETAATVDGSLEIITSVLNAISPIYQTLTTVIIGLLGFFALTTLLRWCSEKNMLSCEDNCLGKINRCLNRTGVCLLFSLGFVLVLAVWILASIMSSIAVVGSDLCIPNVTENLLNGFSLSLANSLDSEVVDVDFCVIDTNGEAEDEFNFSSVSDIEESGNIVCHYSSCTGDNILFKQLEIEEENGVFVSEFVTSALANVNGIPDAGETACIEAKAQVIADLNAIGSLLGEVSLSLACDTITPIYVEIVNDEFCNGVISGLGIIFVTWTVGAAGMMLAMYCYLLLDEEKGVNLQKDVVVVREVKAAERVPSYFSMKGSVQSRPTQKVEDDVQSLQSKPRTAIPIDESFLGGFSLFGKKKKKDKQNEAPAIQPTDTVLIMPGDEPAPPAIIQAPSGAVFNDVPRKNDEYMPEF